MYSQGICYTGLEDVAWGVPQWLTHASIGETLVVVQSLRRDVTEVKFWSWCPGGFLKSCWLSVYTGPLKKPSLTPTTTGNEGTYQTRGEAEASKQKVTFFLVPPYFFYFKCDISPEGRRRGSDLEWVLLLQMIWLRKFHPGVPSCLGLLIPDVANVTVRITIANLYQRTCQCFCKTFFVGILCANSGGNTMVPDLSVSEWAPANRHFLIQIQW